jgi:predicted RNase H-like HicB family nuclease
MLLHNTNLRWAYVIVSAPVLEGITQQGKNAKETLAMLKEFIAHLAPEIMKSDPDLVARSSDDRSRSGKH